MIDIAFKRIVVRYSKQLVKRLPLGDPAYLLGQSLSPVGIEIRGRLVKKRYPYIRKLFQQREAYLLHHAEHLAMRQVAIAMDCSMDAAATHLIAARAALKNVAGADYERFSKQASNAYSKLTPTGDVELPAIEKRIRRFTWPRRIWRVVSPILALAILAALIWGAWRLYRLLDI